MDVGVYIKMLEQGSKVMRCTHCGMPVPVLGDYGICFFCDMPVSTASEDLVASANLKGSLDSISSSITSGKWDDASKVFDGMVANGDYSHAYSAARFYSHFSDYALTTINHISLTGFMEENAEANYKAIELYKKAKQLYYKAIHDASAAPESNEIALYVKFLSEFRLHNVPAAVDSITEINMLKADDVITAYSNFLYSGLVNDRKNRELYSKKLLQMKVPNHLYYVALDYAEGKKYKDAEELLLKLTSFAYIPEAYALLSQVEDKLKTL